MWNKSIFHHYAMDFFLLFFFNQFAPSKETIPLKCKGLLAVNKNEKILEGTGNPILNGKQEINLYCCSKKLAIGKPIYSHWKDRTYWRIMHTNKCKQMQQYVFKKKERSDFPEFSAVCKVIKLNLVDPNKRRVTCDKADVPKLILQTITTVTRSGFTKCSLLLLLLGSY